MDMLLKCFFLSFSFLLLIPEISAEVKLTNSTRRYIDRTICQVKTKITNFTLEGCKTISRGIPACVGVCRSFTAVQGRYPATMEYCGYCKSINRPQVRKIRLVFQCEDNVERTRTMYYYKVKQCGCRQ